VSDPDDSDRSDDGEGGADEAAGRAGMDEFSAHLDRGWDQLQAGNLAGARVAAHAALKLEPDAPDCYTLLGAIAAGRGDTDEALEQFARATELDPDFVDPVLHAAEVHIWPLADYDEAIRLCDQALDLAEEEEEYLDALLLKTEAQIAKGDDAGARATLGELPPTSFGEPQLHLRAGRALLDLGDLDDAEHHLRLALEGDASLTDALHALGLVHEERGDAKKMVQTFIQVREADLKEPPPAWGVPRERFEELAQAAFDELPERIRNLLDNVPVLPSDYPALELVAEGNDPRMMGFFSGVPWPEKSAVLGAPPHLDCVFLYQRNIERVCRTPDEVEEEIRKTLLHETGHFFGLSEEELEAMGLG
jgi:predicted Zn-dependent protease with MMP-like domain/Tfp pilus assembly protein PilF